MCLLRISVTKVARKNPVVKILVFELMLIVVEVIFVYFHQNPKQARKLGEIYVNESLNRHGQ